MKPIIRVHVIAEGQTEEAFANQILKPYFVKKDIYIYPRAIITSFDKGKSKKHRGGVVSYEQVEKNIKKQMTEDPQAYLTTMIDFYALPDDFPGKAKAKEIPNPDDKIIHIEDSLKKDIGQDKKIDIRKFIPYIQLHEFEALLFTSPEKINEYMSLYNQSNSMDKLKDSIKKFETPEHINQDKPPSKIIEQIYPRYQKRLFGSRIAKKIGVSEVKTSCNHFKQWIEQIEKIEHIK